MKQPPLITPREVDVPRAQRHTLPNGASLYAIPSDDFEVLRFTFVFRAGSSMQHAPFAASATANMLSEGSRDMTARQIAERLDFHGSYFEVNVDRDYVYISFSSLSKFFGPTLEVAEQILLQPLFPEDELRAYCEKRKQTLTIERRKVDTVVREIFAEALFGDQTSLRHLLSRERLRHAHACRPGITLPPTLYGRKLSGRMQRPHRGGGVARHRRPGRKTPPCRPQRHSRFSGLPAAKPIVSSKGPTPCNPRCA